MLRDPSVGDLLGGRPRRSPVVLSFVAAVLALASVVTIAVVATGHLAGAGDAGSSSSPEPVVSPVPSPASDTGASEVLSLPQPTSYQGAVPMGYPHSQPGAIAAAYGYSRLASGVDVPTTLDALGLMADPRSSWFGRERDSLADGLVEQREGLGLPPTGPAMSAALTITPSGYQVLAREAGSDFRVLTLNVISASGLDGARTTGVVVLDWALRWDGARWVVTRMFSNPDHDALAVTPLTSAARAAGWQVASGG